LAAARVLHRAIEARLERVLQARYGSA